MNASSTRTPRKRSKSREISENTKIYFWIFRQGRKSKSNEAHHLLLTWSATKGGVPMRIELKSLWRSHLPMGPSLSGKYKKKHSWTFPSKIFGIHSANFLKTPAGASGRYNYHTTTMQKDRSATWNLQRRTNGRDLETKQIPIEETIAILPIGAATYSSLSSSDSLIFFSQVSSSPCSKVFPSSTILPWKTGHSCDSGIPFQVYAQTAHAIFNMADVEDDEKFLYGGKVFLACYGSFLLYVGFTLRFRFHL